MNRLPLSLALLAALLLAAPTPSLAKPKFRIYRVERGDSCWSIALKFFGKGEKYSVIHRYNRLGPLPHLLKEGQALRLPLSAQNPDARIGWLRRDVRARAPYAVDWRRAKRDMGLWRLYKVSTGESSAAGIAFEDASQLRMRERALLVIYGATARSARARRKIKTQLKVEEGTVVGGLAKLDAARSLRIKTPSALIDLRSRRSQIEVDKRKTSIVSVHDGKADVSAKGTQVTVPENYGTRVLRGRRPAKPRPLPARPRWAARGDGLIAIPAGAKARLEARWRPVKGAKRYRVELARDKAFRFPIAIAVVGAGITRFRGQDLGVGDYYARVSAIDRWRLEGRPSTIRRWRVVPLSASRRLEPRKDGSFEAVGLLRLGLPKAIGYEASVDGGPFRTAAIVRLVKPGTHTLRFRSRGSREVSSLRVRLLKVQATLDAPQKPLAAGAKSTLELRLRDERGRPAVLPDLRARLLTALPKPTPPPTVTPTGAGSYRVTLRAPATTHDGPTTAAVAITWAGGELTRATLRLRRPAAPAPRAEPVAPPPWEPPPPLAGATLLEWGATAAVGLPARDARPQTAVGLSSHVAPLRVDGADDPVLLRLAVKAQLALLDDRLGLDVDVPWYNGDLRVDEAGDNDLGHVRLGARFVAWRRAGWAIAPSLRVTLPSGDLAGQWRAASFEPAAIVEWRTAADRLVLGSNVVLPIQTDFERTRLFIGQSLAAGYRLWRGLTVGVELDWLISLRDPADQDRSVPLVAGAQLAWESEWYRLALAGGAGLSSDARREYGSFSLGLVLDVFVIGRAKAPPEATLIMGLRLRSKLILALLGLALVPLAVTTAVVVQVTTRSLERASRDYRVATADYARFTIRQLLERAESELGTIGAALAEQRPAIERQRRARALMLGSRYIDRVAVYAPSGEHLFTLTSDDARQVERLPRVDPGVAAIARKEGLAPLAVKKSAGAKGNPYALPVVVPVYTGKEKRVYAYLWSALPLAPLDALLGELSRRRFGQQDDRVFLVDHQLMTIAHAHSAARGRSIRERGLLGDLPSGQTPRQDIAYAAEYTHDGEQLLGILVPLGQPLGWSVVVEQRSAEVFRAVRSTWGTAVVIGVGFAAAALLLGVMMGSRLARPISAVASAARRVAAGDFEARVPARGNDEVASMGHAFNQMAQDLRDFRAKLVEETRIRADLGRYLGADVVETIVDGSRSVELGGERREVTVLFADVVAFTPLAEKHAPEHVVGILNELFTFLTEIVFKHGGTVDKFIGDCVMAVFGAPYQHDDDALRAVRAAEEMLRWLETGNAKWRKDLGRELSLGIGVHTGEALAGNLGSEKRMEYTVIGDTVNVAARLEALAQPGQVLMSEATAKQVEHEFDLNALGGHKVAGREQELALYELDD